MIKVGLTGNMGSGKSIVARVFQCLGVPVFYADIEAKKLLFDPQVIDQLQDLFGKEIMFDDYIVDRKKLADVVFNDPHALAKLNNLIHPLLQNEYEHWCLSYKNQPYVIQEAAILFESGWDKNVQQIICVTAPQELAIKRAAKRDMLNPEQVSRRLEHQWDQEKKASRSHFVLINDESRLLLPQILDIHKNLLKQFKYTV